MALRSRWLANRVAAAHVNDAKMTCTSPESEFAQRPIARAVAPGACPGAPAATFSSPVERRSRSEPVESTGSCHSRSAEPGRVPGSTRQDLVPVTKSQHRSIRDAERLRDLAVGGPSPREPADGCDGLILSESSFALAGRPVPG